ncbi:cytochrome c [Geomonas limicola]|uniref:Cytochrome c n=1 Tax=Geomonas limicola TaxID=2740186 RepID=A0A6V8N975_9BACT|nr:cytochrome c3 family protein [Geomonas limicola]GFO68434.1 cytochrome c [Geomonas limicola]
MRFGSAIIVLTALAASVTVAAALELKEVTYNTPGAGKVLFSHKQHMNMKSDKLGKVSCKSCHDNGKTSSNVRYSMADMEKGKSCGKCHDGNVAFSINKCTACHKVKEITYQVKQTGTVRFSHAKHLKDQQCEACHPKLFVTGPNRTFTMAEMEKGKSCGACHNGSKAFALANCGGCHPTKEIVFNVKQTGPTRFSHKTHQQQYDCSACHSKLYPIGPRKTVTMAAMKKGKSCGACHNGKEAFAVTSCGKCHPVKDINFKLAGIANVKFSHTAHLEKYSCTSCHTRTFPLKSGNKPVSMAEMRKAKSCGACHDGSTAFTVRGNCDSCHVHG